MKKNLLLFTVFMVLAMVLSSCFNMNPDDIDNSDTENNLEYIALNSEEVRETEIVVKGGITVGSLSFWTERSIDTGNMGLHLLIKLGNGWELNETYIGTKTSPYPVIVDYTKLKNHFYGTGADEEKFVLDLGNLPEETEGIYFAIYSIFEKYGFIDKASGPCKYYVPFAGDPELGVEVESVIDATKEIVYDWEITKTVEPEVMELEEDASGTFEYTLKATRTKVDEIDNYSASGTLTVFNAGPVEDPRVVATVTVQYKDGTEWKELKEEGIIGVPGISIEASNTTGYDYPFTIAFDPGSYTEIRILATAKDAYSYTAEDHNDHSLSGLTPEVTDESALVIDGYMNLIDFEGEGFTVESAATWPWELNDVTGGTKTYTATITNTGAPQGLYSLTNKATLTENDTLTKRITDARILITVPDPQVNTPSIEASVSQTVAWERETKYDWEIEKEVDPTSITLDTNESTELEYTIVATRLEPTVTSTYTITGRATATNDGDVDLADVVIGVTLGSEEATSFIGLISQGDEIGFDFTFEVNSDFDPFTVTVTATGTAGVEVTDTDSYDATAPQEPTPDSIEDAVATIIDRVMHMPDGFNLDLPVKDWEVTESSTVITYIATITNESADPGNYYLTNIATLTEFNTKRKVKDDARVDIDVPSSDISAVVSANVEWERELEYDWTLTKEIDPTEAILNKGESVDLAYTLTAERDEGETEDSTYTIKGEVVVENTGAGKATGVDVEVEMVNPNITKTLVTGDTINSGTSKTYEFTFVTKTERSSYDINAEVTSDNGGDTDSTTANTPDDPTTETIIDEESFIEDEVTNLPSGFSIDPYIMMRNWVVTEPSTTITYYASLTNEEAGSGTYYLTNSATLTESDTGEKQYDDATVTITVPSDDDLIVELETNVKWEEEIIYDWLVEKTVDPTEVTLPVGGSALLDYTITATRNVATSDSTYTVSGTVTVTNGGNIGATGVNVDVELYETGDAKNLATGESIAANDYKKYGFEFVTKNYHSSYRVIATVTADAHPDVTKDNTKDTPIDPEKGQYIDETASVEDNTRYIPTGFSIFPSNTKRTWNLSNSETLFYSIMLTNNSHYTYESYSNFLMQEQGCCCINDKLELLNEVLLTEDDTKETHEDNAKVIIVVPECDAVNAWGEGEKFESGWAMYFYLSPVEDSTTVRLIAAEIYDVGEIKAEWTTYNNISAVRITYKTDSGFRIAEIHTDIVYDPNKWPVNPSPGLFEINLSFYSNPRTTYTFTKTNREREKGVYIAAHAIVINCDGYFDN